MKASARYLESFVIYQRKKMNEHLLVGCSLDTVWVYSENGERQESFCVVIDSLCRGGQTDACQQGSYCLLTDITATNPSKYWMTCNARKLITFYNITLLFAYTRACTIDKAVSAGFYICGLWPFNPAVFSRFSPSLMTGSQQTTSTSSALQTVSALNNIFASEALWSSTQVEVFEVPKAHRFVFFFLYAILFYFITIITFIVPIVMNECSRIV